MASATEPTLLLEWRNIRRLLAMRLDNAGDVIMLGPALRALRECYPSVHLTLMTSRVGARAARLLPWIDEILEWRVLWQDLGSLPFDPDREWRLAEALKTRAFDAMIVFTSFSQTPFPAGYVAELAGIPLRLGESCETEHGSLTHQPTPFPRELHQVERNLRLIESIGVRVKDRGMSVSVTNDAEEYARQLLVDTGITDGADFLLVNPWATAEARMYPIDRLETVCRLLHEATAWPVVVTGNEQEEVRSVEFVRRAGPGVVSLAGKTDLCQLSAMTQRARVVLTNDTSTLHLADALRVPEVVLFSGTDLEEQWCPRDTPCKVLRRPTACSPCYTFVCPNNMECLDIPPEEVVSAALDLLAETQPTSGPSRAISARS